ncbi:ATP-binding cassette sub-family A member 3 like protein [Argiope bruennichi]|uniref:ATP-binding cassette sub-family A member 3 like protein n=1 Tax=Argiope bruennichi TaxID=94029 RepID=A0A8T0FDB8_ARGBR|nr:ATP-binding cassette sub-family A member 3 like protein [Argiope bruennichi]
MEVVHQVRLLLRRNVALRLRQPVILALELLWPVVIFLVVMAARNAIPPVAQPTCYYKAWALPSAGVVPFVQSMICNIDDCQNQTEYEDIPSYNGSSVRELVANTMPLIMDHSITELVTALPKGMRLMRVAVDALSGPDLSVLLDEGFPVTDLLKDTNQTRELLSSINMTDDEIELTLESSIQLPQILEITSQSNFCDTFQDLIEDTSNIFDKIRFRLCSMDEISRKDFFRRLKSQLDVKNIVQTMGLAMSELGRLDIGEILGNIGVLLANLQSSNIFHEDILKMIVMVLDEVRFDQIDTKVIRHLIEDLEPLYRESEWAMLIQVLKDVKLPNMKRNSTNPRRIDAEANKAPYIAEMESAVDTSESSANKERFNFQRNAANTFETVLSLADIGMDMLKFLPRNASIQAENALKYFAFFVDVADGIVPEIEKSLKRDDSTKFLDTFSDILGAAFLNIAEETKSKNQNVNFCNAKEFQTLLNSSDWNDIPALQRYACKISRVSERRPVSSDEMNVEKWRSSVSKMKNLMNFDKYSEIRHNIAKWQNEANGNATTGFTAFKKSPMSEATIDDVISTIECTIQGFQDFNSPKAGGAKNITGTYLSTIPQEISNKISNNKRKIFLNGLSRTKEIINHVRNNYAIFGQMNLTNFGTMLTELDKLVNGIGAGSFGHFLTSTSKEFLRFIPAVAFMTKDFKTNTTARRGLPSLTSAFIQDLETFIWNSISPKMVEEFAKKPLSDNFCVDAYALEATQLHWKWLLCTDSSKSFKYPASIDSISSSDLEFKPVNNFDAQIFSQILLRLSSSMSFTVKVISQFLHPVKGCDSTCGSEDIMLKKMCFLARLQNAKSVIEIPKRESNGHEENIMEDDNFLQQFQTLLPIDEHIIEGYASFMDVVRASAANNFTSWRDIVRLVVSGLRFLDSFDGKDRKLRPSLHVINSLVSLVKNRVSDAAQSSSEAIVEIQNVFPDSPLTQEVVKSFLPVLPEVTSTLFWTALVPGKVLKLIDNSDKNISIIISTICNSSLTDYFYNPGLSSDEFERLDQVLCSHRYYDVFEEIFEDPDIQEIVFDASSTDEVSWEDMHDNILETVSLLQDLAERKKADISSFPPLPRWQKMARGIHSQVMNPAVMLYVFNSKFFYRFCSDQQPRNMSAHLKNFFTTDQETTLYKGLCSISTASFSAKLVESVNDTFKNSETEKGKNPDVASLSQKIIGVFFSMPEIKDIGKLFLGMDLHDDIDGGEEEGHILQNGANRYKIMNATKRTFDMVDSVTGGRLSATILGSSFPEILQDVSALILPSDIFQERNSKKLKSLCNNLKQRLPAESSDDFSNMVCSQPPAKWTLKNLNQHQNYTSLWTEIDMFLSDEAKNATQELYFRKESRYSLTPWTTYAFQAYQFTDWSSFQMPSFYFSMMRAFVRNLEGIDHSNIQETGCLTRSSQEAIQDSVHKLLNSISGAEFLSCGLLNKNISGLYSWISESADLKQAFEKVAHGVKIGEICTHSWKWLQLLIDDLEALYKRLSQNMSEKELHEANNCLRNFKQSLLISSLQMHANVIKQAAKFVSTINTPAGHWKGIKEQIFQRISQHLPAFIRLSEIIPESSSILPPSFEMDDTEIEEVLREASINFNWHLRHGLSSTTLRKKICDNKDDPSVSTVFLRPPQMSLMTRAKFYGYICNPNVTQHLVQQLNQSYIKDKVREIQEKEFFSGQWLQALMGSSDILIDVGTHLISSMTEIQIHNLFDIFHLFTKPHVIQNVYESLGKLILVLEPVFPGSSLIETLQQILDGLQAFKSLTQLTNFSFSYKVKDVFGDATIDVLMNELQVDSEELFSFLESEISLNQVVLDKRSGHVSFCENSRDTSILCTLSKNERTAISAEHLQDLVFQKFLISFGSLGVEGVLKEAKVDAVEAEKTLEILSNAPNVITPKTLPDGGPKKFSKKNLISFREIFFMLLSPEDAENKIEERELLRLPTDFCRHGYKEIMKMRGGAILWGFLKPLFRGKILYAPKDYGPASHHFPRVNETFNILEEQVHFVKAAAEGSTGLHYLQRKNETLQSLQKLLSSKAVSKFLGSPSWGAALSWLEAPSSSSLSLLHLVELVGNVTECISLDRFLGFDTEEELEAAAATLHDRREFIAAIVFMQEKHLDKRWADGKQEHHLPKNVLYKIRMDIDNVPTTEYIKYRWWRPYPYDDFFEDLRYFRGFLQLQDTVDSAIIDLQTQSPGSSSEVKKYLQQFPYPCHQRDKFGTLLKGSMPAVMTISWVFIVAFLVRERVLDHSWCDGLTQEFRLARVVCNRPLRTVSFCDWYCSCAEMGRDHTKFGPCRAIPICSGFCCVADCLLSVDELFLQSSFHSSIVIGFAVCFVLFSLPTFCHLGIGFSILAEAVIVCTGIHFLLLWLLVFEPVRGSRSRSSLVQHVAKPGLKGRKPLAWYVLLKPPALVDKKIENGFADHNTKPRSIIEGVKDQTNAKRITGISLSNVHALYSKKGSKEWRALSGLNLDLYEDQITALLGHNGAGKTTTIKILTGRKLPTTGKVSLYGYPIPEKLAEARKLIGYAPQNNTLYDKLTVKEHLNLFARLKGILDANVVKKEVNEMLNRLNLIEKQDECTETLSGGQRRRLCVGIAFVGGSKVVILDEPTSSVDPVARRKIWDLILSYKKVDCDGVMECIQTYVPDATLLENDGSHLVVSLPADPLTSKPLSEFFTHLEKCLHLWGFQSCSISSATLEEVFLTLCRLEDAKAAHNSEKVPLTYPSTERQVANTVSRRNDIACVKTVITWISSAPFYLNSLNNAILKQKTHNTYAIRTWSHPLRLSVEQLGRETLLQRLGEVGIAFVFLIGLSLVPCTFAVYIVGERESEQKRLQMVTGALSPLLYWGAAFLWDLTIVLATSLVSAAIIQNISQVYNTKAGHRYAVDNLTLYIPQGECFGLVGANGAGKTTLFRLLIGEIQPTAGKIIFPGLQSERKKHQFLGYCPQKDALDGLLTPRQHLEIYAGLRGIHSSEVPKVIERSLKSLELDTHADRPVHKLSGGTKRKLCTAIATLGDPELVAPAMVIEMKEKDSPTSRRGFRYSAHLRYNQLNSLIKKRFWHTKRNWKALTSSIVMPCVFIALAMGLAVGRPQKAPDPSIELTPALYASKDHKAISFFAWDEMETNLGNTLLSVLKANSTGNEICHQGDINCSHFYGNSRVMSGPSGRCLCERECPATIRELTSSLQTPDQLLYNMSDINIPQYLLDSYLQFNEKRYGGWTLQKTESNDISAKVWWDTPSTPLTYFETLLPRRSPPAFLRPFTSHLFVGLVIMMSLVSLRMISVSKDVATILSTLQRFSLAFPQYSLVGGLTDLNENQIKTEIFEQFGQDVYVSPFSWTSLGPNFVALFVQGVVFFLLTVLLEILPLRHWCQRLLLSRKHINNQQQINKNEEDDSIKSY